MKYLLANSRLLDGTLDERGEMPVRTASVAVNGDRIERILENVSSLPGYETVDLSGKFLMPGLINLHVHLAASGKPPKKNAKPVNYKRLFRLLSGIRPAMTVFRKMEEGLAKQHLYSGVTTIRTVGGVLDLDGKVRDKIRDGKCEGPRILTCNTAVSVPGGHFAGSLATEAENPEMAKKQIEEIARTRPDWIKLMITGGVMDASAEGEPGVLRMEPEIIQAACEKAHSLGYKVAAHVESPEGVRAALEYGVDTVEHGARPDREILSLFMERGAALVCTLSPALPYVRLPEEISHCGDLGRKNGRVVFEGIVDCARKCLDEGIPVGLGTDAGCSFVTAYDFWREIAYFVRFVGVTPSFALYTATAGNAALLGMGDEIGQIREGMCADLLVTDSDPRLSPRALRVPYMVMTRGRLIRAPKIKKNRAIEEALDSIL